MTNLQTYLQEVRSREEKATGKPWVVFPNNPFTVFRDKKPSIQSIAVTAHNNKERTDEAKYNASLIAHSRTDVPKLLAIVEEMSTFIDSVASGVRLNDLSEEFYATRDAARVIKEKCEEIANG